MLLSCNQLRISCLNYNILFITNYALCFLAMITLWMIRNKQSIAAIVIPVHHASSRPAELTMFWIVESERTPNNVPMMLPTTPESILPPMIDDAMAIISIPVACEGDPDPMCRKNIYPPIPASTLQRR